MLRTASLDFGQAARPAGPPAPPPKANSQNEAVLRYLEAGRGITPRQAYELCGTMRLARCIHDLRTAGHHIETELVELNGRRFARYWLLEEEVR